MFNFQIHGDFLEVAKQFKDTLDADVIRGALATTLNSGQTKAKKLFVAYVGKTYNISETLLTKKNGYRIKRARGDSAEPASTAFISSKPLSMRTFVVANRPVDVFIKNRVPLKHAFLVGTDSTGDGTTGVFIASRDATKVKPTKGRYANRIIKRGPKKGQVLLRRKIDKMYTLSTADASDSGSAQVIQEVDLVKAFGLRLDKILAKKTKAEAKAAADQE